MTILQSSDPTKSRGRGPFFRRRLALWLFLVALALLRVECAQVDMTGRKYEPSHLFRLAPAGDGTDGWEVSFLGYEGRTLSPAQLLDRSRTLWQEWVSGGRR